MSKLLRHFIREQLLESMIEEKFGEKIGMQPSLVGVRDERDDLDEGDPIDLGESQVKRVKQER